MEDDLSLVRTANRELLDTYLEYGIGHYYTIAKMLSSSATDELNQAERHSVGIEMSALASAALDNLVTWYQVLGQWRTGETEKLLIETLDGLLIDDSHRLEALKQVTSTQADEFCRLFGIPWRRDQLRANRIDASNWRYTVDQAKLNIAKVLEDLAPVRDKTPRAWVVQYLSSIKQGYLLGSGRQRSVPTVRAVPQNDQAGQGVGDLTAIPSDPGSLGTLARLIGNAAVGLFLLVRLLYVSTYGQEPSSPAFVVIWQELYPASGPGRGP